MALGLQASPHLVLTILLASSPAPLPHCILQWCWTHNGSETLQVLAHICAPAHTFPRMFFPSLSSLLPHVQQENTYCFSMLIASATSFREFLTALILQHCLLACLPPHCAVGPLVRGQRGVHVCPTHLLKPDKWVCNMFAE